MTHDTGPVARKHRPWWNTALRIVALLVIAAVVVALLRGKLPKPSEIWRALQTADWRWVLAAAALQVVSIGMVIRQQRRLLRAFGVPVTYKRVGAITYSANAIAMSMPGGAAVSAGWSYKQYRASGATSATAATVMLLSGVLSILALVTLYLLGLGAAASTRLLALGREHPGITAAIGIGLLLAVVLVIWWLAAHNHRDDDPESPTPKLDAFAARHPKLGAAARQTLTTLRQAREIRAWDWNVVMTTSAAKWLLDAACLYASCRAFDVHIDLFQLSAIYVGIQLVRQVPLTPGGIGLIEVSLLAGLVSAGAPQGSAAAAIVIYRMISAWLLIPVGFLMMAWLRARENQRSELYGEPDTPEERTD